MPIIPSGGGYPGIIGEAELIASAVASVAADKAASTAAAADADAARVAAQADAADVDAAKAAAVPDAADVAAAKAAAVPDAADVAAAKAAAVPDAADVSAAKAQAQADAGTIAGLVTPAQTDAQTVADLVAPAQADAAAAGTAKADAEAYAADAYAAMVAAGNSNKVATDDWRLGLRSGVTHTASGATTPINSTSGWRTVMATFGSGVLGVAGQSTEIFRAGALYQEGSLIVSSRQDTGRTSVVEGTAGGAYYHTTGLVIPAGVTACACTYNATANTISIWFDGVLAATYTRQSSVVLAPLSEASKSAGGRVQRAFAVFNFELSGAEQIALMRGEYPQAWVGGCGAVTTVNGWTDAGWTAVSGATVSANGTSVTAYTPTANAATSNVLRLMWTGGSILPTTRPGRVVRIYHTLTGTATGAVRLCLFDLSNGGAVVATPGSGYTDFTTTVTMATPVLGLRADGAADFTFAVTRFEVLGAQVLVGPQDWTRTRGVDMSGNCNDLIYGTGVVAIEPATKTRVISATAAGATLSAGAVGSIGAISGATYRDAKAIAALRQWDAVSANWRQARPANCAALLAAVTANGTPLVEATAITGNAVIAANAALNLTHTIN